MTNLAESSIATILIFTDFSDAATNASKYAAALAMQLHAKKMLLCYSEHIPSAMEVHLQNIQLEEQTHQRYLVQLEALKHKLRNWTDRSITIDAYIDKRPLEIIVNNFKNDMSIGLIIMGVAGKNAVKQTLVGSNTVRITKITSVPLLVIPESVTFKTIEKVVFACDLKNISKHTPILAIKNMVSKLGAKLSILNVRNNEEHFKPEIIEKRNYLSELWGNEKLEYDHINNQGIVRGIMDFANAKQVQLVIAVPKKYGFFEKLFHESLTRKLTHHINLPLLFFKEESSS